MKALKSVLTLFLIAVVGGGLVYQYNSVPSKKVWGAGGEPYMVISGQKPTDAVISVRVNYFGRGDACSGWSWNAGSGDINRGIYNESFKIDHNFSGDEAHYELRIPYQQRQPEKNCFTQLSDMEVKLTNAFDTVGFANLRVYQAGAEYYNKPLDLSSKIEAKNCDSYIFKGLGKVWSGSLGCNFFLNEKKMSKKPEYNAESVYFDFSQFNDETVIHYDILAGENYRSAPLDPQTGK